jgi:short-subunit dehydrogenase
MTVTTRRTALVTGASAGIGKAFAHELAGRDFDLVITARRRERLVELASELSAQRGARVEIVVADLADPGAPQAIFDELARRGIAVDMLVNNAGYGVSGAYAGSSWKAQADFLQVLVTAVAHLTHVFLPGMLQRDHGHIINVASLAGLIYGAPGNTLYGAAKAFVIKFTESLSLELARTGVRATAVCPGFTMSEFHDVTGTRERVSKMPRAMWMDADAVAREGVDAALGGKVVYVNGGVNKLIASAMRHLPPSVARGIIQRQAKNFREVD